MLLVELLARRRVACVLLYSVVISNVNPSDCCLLFTINLLFRNHQYLILKLSRRAHTMASMLVNLSRNLRRANYVRGNLWTNLSSAAKPRPTSVRNCKCIELFLINFVEFIFDIKMGEMIEVSNG